MNVAADPEPASRPESPVPSAPRATRTDAPPFTGRHLLFLLLLTLLAAALRLSRLGDWSFWVDEAHTYRDVTLPFRQFWDSHVARYPLSYLLLRGMLEVLPSSSEGWLRLPFAFFGIASVPALALVGRGIVGRRAALAAAALLAVSPWHIYWSQNCRSYAAVLFLSVLAMGAFFAADRQRTAGLGFLTIGITVVAGLCHPSAYLLLAAYLSFAGLSRLMSTGSEKADAIRTPLERWLPWAVLGTVIALVPILIGGISYFARAKPGFSLSHLIQTTAFFVRIPLGVAALGGFLLLFHRGERTALFLACWIAAPFAVLASGISAVTAQYAFYTLPAFCLLAGAAAHGVVAHISDPSWVARMLRLVPISILMIDAASGTFLYFAKQHGDRPNWRAARDYIERIPGRDEYVLTTNGPSMCYYLDPEHMLPNLYPGSVRVADESAVSTVVTQVTDWVVRQAQIADPARPEREIKGGEAYLLQHVERARRDRRALFVVVTEPELDEMDPSGALDRALRTRFHQVLRVPVWNGPKDMDVLVYELPPLDAPPR